MYSWLIFLHVLSVVGFLAAHGAAVALTFDVQAVLRRAVCASACNDEDRAER